MAIVKPLKSIDNLGTAGGGDRTRCCLFIVGLRWGTGGELTIFENYQQTMPIIYLVKIIVLTKLLR